jgi:hypothetical protein
MPAARGFGAKLLAEEEDLRRYGTVGSRRAQAAAGGEREAEAPSGGAVAGLGHADYLARSIS